MKDRRTDPPQIESDENAVQIANIWIANNSLQCSLKIGMYSDVNIDERHAWGIILCDIARHVANGLSQLEETDFHDNLEQIQISFNSEMRKSKTNLVGSIER